MQSGYQRRLDRIERLTGARGAGVPTSEEYRAAWARIDENLSAKLAAVLDDQPLIRAPHYSRVIRTIAHPATFRIAGLDVRIWLAAHMPDMKLSSRPHRL